MLTYKELVEKYNTLNKSSTFNRNILENILKDSNGVTYKNVKLNKKHLINVFKSIIYLDTIKQYLKICVFMKNKNNKQIMSIIYVKYFYMFQLIFFLFFNKRIFKKFNIFQFNIFGQIPSLILYKLISILMGNNSNIIINNLNKIENLFIYYEYNTKEIINQNLFNFSFHFLQKININSKKDSLIAFKTKFYNTVNNIKPNDIFD